MAGYVAALIKLWLVELKVDVVWSIALTLLL